MESEHTALALTSDGTYSVRVASVEDLPVLHSVQREAFGRIAVALGIDPVELPPVAEELRHLQELQASGTIFLVATECGGSIVGTVRGTLSDGTVHIGRLAVSSGHRRRGIARALMEGLESVFPGAEYFELFTGADASVPIHLYLALGYVITRYDISQGWDLVWLSKPGSACEPAQ